MPLDCFAISLVGAWQTEVDVSVTTELVAVFPPPIAISTRQNGAQQARAKQNLMLYWLSCPSL